MAVTSRLYGLAQQSMLNKQIDFDSDTVQVMLCTSGYTPDQDTHRYKSSVTSEVVGTNYTAGGLPLTNRTVAYTAGTNTLVLDCDDVVWPSASFTARFAVFYIDTGSAATSPLLCYWDFGVDVTAVTAPFTLFINAAGLVTVAAA